MPPSIQLTLSPDEAQIVIDALEADLDDYLDEASEARRANNAHAAGLFEDAAERIRALLATLSELTFPEQE